MHDYSISSMGHGDHFCLFFRDAAEQLALTVTFLSAGLKRRERCLYLGDEESCARVAAGLSSAKVGVAAELERGALVLDSGRDYLSDGRFDPDAMIGFLEGSVDAAMAAGFTGWRATGNTHWEMGPVPDYPALLRYEAMLDRFFHNRPMVGMCQHDLRLFSDDVVPDLLANHRKFVLNGEFRDSHCYAKAGALARGESKRHLELMLSSIAEAVFAHDLQGRLVFANREGHRLLAIPAYKTVFEDSRAASGEVDLVDGEHCSFRGKDGHPLATKDLPWRVALRERRPAEKFLRSADPWHNDERWWLAKSMPLFEGADRFDHCVTVIEDVTERRRLKQTNEQLVRQIAETARLAADNAAQKLLFQEVHHRIKNNLQLLSSLVTISGMRFAGGEISEMLRELQDRIGAISLVHELLYRRGHETKVDLGEYAHAVADAIWASGGAAEKGIDLAVSVAPCPAGMDTAIPVALILTEVLTNCLKHAFPRGQAGRVAVSLAPQGDRWRLVVRDNGVGLLPKAEAGSGIGCGLVRALATQLGGEIAVSAAAGIEFTMRFPIPESP
jgi:two-component sensor histidine kinase/PAS domain-containing protein